MAGEDGEGRLAWKRLNGAFFFRDEKTQHYQAIEKK
jgi:hypothetical protein